MYKDFIGSFNFIFYSLLLLLLRWWWIFFFRGGITSLFLALQFLVISPDERPVSSEPHPLAYRAQWHCR